MLANALMEFVSVPSRRPSLYFRALHHFEMTIAMLWQAFDLTMTVLKEQLFVKNDGSNYQRLNWIYNESRHFDPSKLPLGQIHAVWLNNAGIQTERYGVSFQELEEFLIEIGNLADSISKNESPEPQRQRREM
jgi:hypothetical protein